MIGALICSLVHTTCREASSSIFSHGWQTSTPAGPRSICYFIYRLQLAYEVVFFLSAVCWESFPQPSVHQVSQNMTVITLIGKGSIIHDNNLPMRLQWVWRHYKFP